MIETETFGPLAGQEFIRHGFLCRVSGVDVSAERSEALLRLKEIHADYLMEAGFSSFATAEQVHGSGVARVDSGSHLPISGVDGLITNVRGVTLGIYVADCAAVYLVDPVQQCIGLVHSGKKGTELGIVPETIHRMKLEFGCRAEDLIVQISPCIRPPQYEIDFAAAIIRQCRDSEVGSVFDCGKNTGANSDRYYSYRMEKGKTGRMLAALMIE